MDEERREEERVEPAPAHSKPERPSLDWLEPLYREHSDTVFRAAYRITGNAADAEDVLQTVFFRLAGREDRPELGDGARAYLYRAAANAALDVVRSRGVRSATSLDEAPDLATDRPGDGPEARQLGTELRAQLRRAVACLNQRAAEMFTLRFFEQLDNRTIAGMFDTSPGTVAVTLHRARMRLMDELSSYLGGRR
jgi:RNA polymerase sigma-70 factor (ECF subfamily)